MFSPLPSPDPDIISDPDIWWVTQSLPNRDRDCIFVSAQEGNNLCESQKLDVGGIYEKTAQFKFGTHF